MTARSVWKDANSNAAYKSSCRNVIQILSHHFDTVHEKGSSQHVNQVIAELLKEIDNYFASRGDTKKENSIEERGDSYSRSKSSENTIRQ